MLEIIEEETKESLFLTEDSNLSLQVKLLLKNLTIEISQALHDGDWNLAVKLSHYRHEFAKSHNNFDWYSVFIEIRKIRDMLNMAHQAGHLEHNGKF